MVPRAVEVIADYWDYWLQPYEPPSGGMGMMSTLPVEHERDRVAELRAVVAEVSGKPCEAPPTPRIGFLP